MANTQHEIDSMLKGDIDVIEKNITSEIPILVINSIISGTQKKVKSTRFLDGLKEVKKSKDVLMGHYVKSFAIAALDLLNVDKYSGDDAEIKEIINTNMNF